MQPQHLLQFLLLLVTLSGCATKPWSKGEYWICHAVSERHEKKSHGLSHWATCPGTQWCAREEALKKCLWHHPWDCMITSCSQVPEQLPGQLTPLEKLPPTDDIAPELEKLPNE